VTVYIQISTVVIDTVWTVSSK